MRIKFNGVVEKTVKGCSACGRAKHQVALVRSKVYYLPSGAERMFHVGRVEEVSDSDGEFLLGYQYTTPQGEVRKVFERG